MLNAISRAHLQSDLQSDIDVQAGLLAIVAPRYTVIHKGCQNSVDSEIRAMAEQQAHHRFCRMANRGHCCAETRNLGRNV